MNMCGFILLYSKQYKLTEKEGKHLVTCMESIKIGEGMQQTFACCVNGECYSIAI